MNEFLLNDSSTCSLKKVKIAGKIVRYWKIDFCGKMIHQTIWQMSFSLLYIIHAYFVIISSILNFTRNIQTFKFNSNSRWTELPSSRTNFRRLHYHVINSKPAQIHLKYRMSHATVTDEFSWIKLLPKMSYDKHAFSFRDVPELQMIIDVWHVQPTELNSFAFKPRKDKRSLL